MALVQPLIGLIDAGIGHVGQVAARLDQVGLAGQVTPDNPHLLPIALTPQDPAQLIIRGCTLRGRRDLPAQLARGEGAIQLPGLHKREQHQGITHALFNDKVAGGRYPGEVRPALRRPGRQAMIVIKRRDGGAKGLLGAADKRQENGGQRGKRREAHGLSLIGVEGAVCSERIKCTTQRTVEQKLEIAEISVFLVASIKLLPFLVG
ncbi:hypothetical protein D3C78_1001140 [compost metagenome]